MPKINYDQVFSSIFASLPPGARVDFEVIMGHAGLQGVGANTRKARLRDYIDENPAVLESLTGLVPKPETVIRLVTEQLGGSISQLTLVQANERCRAIIGAITRPMVESFVISNLLPIYRHPSGAMLISSGELAHFLLDEFADYLRASSNSLMSLAGSINEKLLHAALEAEGLTKGVNFSVTGTGSEADIVIHSVAGARANLGVEVKSYRARERLLRGLKDVQVPKVGVGYFVDPAEFNEGRTRTLLQAEPSAIYMPEVTLRLVDVRARRITASQTIAFGSSLYRPIEQFATDMAAFVTTGRLPTYSSPA